MSCLIYKAVNRLDGKIYIGKTTRALQSRIIEHKSKASRGFNEKLYKAIRADGFDNFDWSIVERVDNEDMLDEKEVFWINVFDSFANGYNDTLGGKGSVGRLVSKEENEKRSNTMRNNDYKGENTVWHGVLYENHPRAKSVIQLSLDGKFIAEYSTIKECAEKTGCNKSHIVSCCKGKLGKHKGFKFVYKDDWSE